MRKVRALLLLALFPLTLALGLTSCAQNGAGGPSDAVFLPLTLEGTNEPQP